jgi:pyrimidine-nucleoside phosphorylase
LNNLINKKKYGIELSREEIYYIIDNYTKGEIPDYQMSAFLMAVYFKGFTSRELYDFSMAMAESGEINKFSELDYFICDKHSTGGVGDKVSLVLGPILSSIGVKVLKMSGRGLGFTGGTIDKLECFEGIDLFPDRETFVKRLKDIGISWAGQTSNLAPADKLIYALRDVTGTVDSIPLIASSIMSKKLASGADGIVLDVTCGSGAFMKSIESARELSKTMIKIGEMNNKKMRAVITNMEEPLGYAIGNNLEVIEAIETLKGRDVTDLLLVTLTIGAEMAVMSGVAKTTDIAKEMMIYSIKSGKALDKMKEWIKTQGGRIDYIDNTELFEKAPYITEVRANKEGYIKEINGEKLGNLLIELGGGRKKKEDAIDKRVGIVLNKKISDYIRQEDIIAYIYSSTIDDIVNISAELLSSFFITDELIKKKNVILDIL